MTCITSVSHLKHLPTLSITADETLRVIWRLCILGVISQALGSFLTAVASYKISSGIIGVIFCLESVIAAIAAYLHKLSNSSLDWKQVCGMAICIGGVAMVLIRQFKTSQTSHWELFGYIMLAICATFCYGYGAILSKIYSESLQISVTINVTGQYLFGLLFHLFVSLAIDASNGQFGKGLAGIVDLNPMVWVWSFAMAITSNVMAWNLFTWLLLRIGSEASLYAFLVPCVSLIVGILFNGEWSGITVLEIVVEISGVLVTFFGLFLVVRRNFKYKEKCNVVSEVEMGPQDEDEAA